MDYTIRVAQREDMSQVLHLIQELASFEKEDDAVEVSVQNLEEDGFGKQKLFHCFVDATTHTIGFFNSFS